MAKMTRKPASRKQSTPRRRKQPSSKRPFTTAGNPGQARALVVHESPVPNGLSYWLGMPAAFEKQLRSVFDVLHLSAHGITRHSVDKLASFLGISRKNLAERVFDVSVKTLERKAPQELLDKRISSHAIEIAKLMQHGYEVFRDDEKLRRWLNLENKALNNERPIDLLDTPTGIGMVNDILSRIEEGIYS